ncbi:MAG TPA: hypothetical protein VFP92_10610 [Rhodanobacteraceae bacterium]|nr:hypothetical protein [Rhodanobacteraceae bacterium]
MSEWQPIETAPKHGAFLAYWPAYWLTHDGNLSDDPTGDGYIGAAEMDGISNVSEPTALNAVRDDLGDEWEYGLATHWMPLPMPPNNQVERP